MCQFFLNIYICLHLKLQIVSVIPALNEQQIETNNSATDGLKL